MSYLRVVQYGNYHSRGWTFTAGEKMDSAMNCLCLITFIGFSSQKNWDISLFHSIESSQVGHKRREESVSWSAEWCIYICSEGSMDEGAWIA